METNHFDRDQNRDNLDSNFNQNQRTNGDQTDHHQEFDSSTSDFSSADQDLQSRWTDIESDYRKRYPSLTEEDIDYSDGDFDGMTDRIAKRTNRNYQDVQDEIRNWSSEEGNSEDGSSNDGETPSGHYH